MEDRAECQAGVSLVTGTMRGKRLERRQEGDTGLSIILRGCPGAYQGGQFAVPDLLSTAMGLFQV